MRLSSDGEVLLSEEGKHKYERAKEKLKKPKFSSRDVAIIFGLCYGRTTIIDWYIRGERNI